MKPAVFRPAAWSRRRCIMGRRTRAWMPDRKMAPEVAVYLSSRLTLVKRDVSGGVDGAAPAFLANAVEPFSVVTDMAVSKRVFQITAVQGTRPVRRALCRRDGRVWAAHNYFKFKIVNVVSVERLWEGANTLW